MLIRHLWQLKTVVFLHWSQICAVILRTLGNNGRKKFYDIVPRKNASPYSLPTLASRRVSSLERNGADLDTAADRKNSTPPCRFGPINFLYANPGKPTIVVSHFANLSFCQLVILSTCHFVNLSFCQLVILSTCHFVNLSFCQLVILSTRHFVNSSFCQLIILSTRHFVNSSFCQLVILLARNLSI